MPLPLIAGGFQEHQLALVLTTRIVHDSQCTHRAPLNAPSRQPQESTLLSAVQQPLTWPGVALYTHGKEWVVL